MEGNGLGKTVVLAGIKPAIFYLLTRTLDYYFPIKYYLQVSFR